jgi:hypothetical protein
MSSELPHELQVLQAAAEARADVRIAGYFSCSNCIEHLKAQSRAQRPPLLVVGSGLLSQTGYTSIASWAGLLEELYGAIAPNEPRIPGHLMGLSPTTSWELLVQVLARAGKAVDANSDEPERRAQRKLAELVGKGAEHDRPNASAEIAPGIPVNALLSPRLAGIVSLNFTREPFGDALGRVSITEKERSRSVPSADGLNVYFPHGDIGRPDSLALGLRQYASRLKRWEDLRRKCCGAERGGSGRREPLPIEDRKTFIHHALTSPMIFAGCGLSEVESTLWWLLATRARNCARSVPLSQPLAYFLTAAPLSLELQTKLEFTRCKPIHFRQHTDVWLFVADLIDSLPDWRERPQSSGSSRIRSSSKQTGATPSRGLRPGTIWSAVQAAGLAESSHDLSNASPDEREYALRAAMRVTQATGRSRRRVIKPLGLEQLVVVHTAISTLVLQECRLDSSSSALEQLNQQARALQPSGRASTVDGWPVRRMLVMPDATLKALCRLDSDVQRKLLDRQGVLCGSSANLRSLLKRVALLEARRERGSQRDMPAPHRGNRRIRQTLAAYDLDGSAVCLDLLRKQLDQMGWHDIELPSVGKPVPPQIRHEILERTGALGSRLGAGRFTAVVQARRGAIEGGLARS